MTASVARWRSMAAYSFSTDTEIRECLSEARAEQSPPSEERVQFWGCVQKKIIFLPLGCMKKISSFLSACCLGMSRGVLRAQQWPQEREALEESAETHAAARLRLRRPSGASLWPSLSLCKNQCSPMMCYVKFPEAWFKWLDILHPSLVILQCIAPKSTWTLHEKQM